MKIIKRQDKKEVYTVHQRTKHMYELVKVLNIYNTQDEAVKDMIKLLQHEITEEELLKEYIKKDS